AEVGKIKIHKTGEEFYLGFVPIRPNRFITLVEKYLIPVIQKWDSHNKIPTNSRKSMGIEVANTLIASHALQQALPQIRRVFTVPLPIISEKKLTFPKKGYDERFESWLPYDAPELIKPEMELSEAKKVIDEIFKEFCFDEDKNHNKVNAIAGLLTPFLRGLFSSFNVRTPIFFYLGNRERVGKDYLAGITGIIYEGQVTEESPISVNENFKNNDSNELRKKILSAFLQGRKRLHFSNNKGFIDNAVLESLATNPYFSDRILGRNESFVFANELDLSLSGNMGVSYTPDFANRCRFIKLFLGIENANERKFNKPNLHIWVKENRGLILSALFSLVKNWFEKGSPKGTIPFTSYPEWASICGGILESAGYGSPCIPDIDSLVGGDVETSDMKRLFELCYEKHPNIFITKEEVRNIITDSSEEIFSEYNFTKDPDKTKFGIKFKKYIGRILSGITLQVDVAGRVSTKQKVRFSKELQKTLESNNEEQK
ncbi:MAG: hypothetical protein Q8L27_03450, partial [archaeon]|nr:hypothetical protein [archaeon]